jgi:hypothetical protein
MSSVNREDEEDDDEEEEEDEYKGVTNDGVTEGGDREDDIFKTVSFSFEIFSHISSNRF